MLPLMSSSHLERSKKAFLMFGNRHCVWMLASMEIYTQPTTQPYEAACVEYINAT